MFTVMANRVVTLAATPLPVATLPSEFLVFRKGPNPSSKGTAIFDDAAARSVLAKYRAQNTDLIVDLEHESLGPAVRADSRDARGWFKLELRAGALYAVGVKWTEDGARRLRTKSQRYTSPAFYQDPETFRILELVNIGLVAMPATFGAQPLVAASRYGARNSTTVSVRLSRDERRILELTAKRMGLSIGQFARAIALAAHTSNDPIVVKEKICRLLGISPDTATLQEIVKILEGLLAEPTTQPTDSVPAPDVRARAAALLARRFPEPKLSQRDLALCKERGIDPTEFSARKRAAVRRA